MDRFIPLVEAEGMQMEPDMEGKPVEFNSDDNIVKDRNNSSSCSVDNSKTVINKIANLYAERLMSDVCLVVGNVSHFLQISYMNILV